MSLSREQIDTMVAKAYETKLILKCTSGFSSSFVGKLCDYVTSLAKEVVELRQAILDADREEAEAERLRGRCVWLKSAGELP